MKKNIYVCIMCVLFVYEIVYIDMFLKILEILVIVFGFWNFEFVLCFCLVELSIIYVIWVGFWVGI